MAHLIQDTYLGTIADLVNNEESTLKGDGILAPKGQSGEVDGVTYDAADTFTLVIKMQEKAGRPGRPGMPACGQRSGSANL